MILLMVSNKSLNIYLTENIKCAFFNLIEFDINSTHNQNHTAKLITTFLLKVTLHVLKIKSLILLHLEDPIT